MIICILVGSEKTFRHPWALVRKKKKRKKSSHNSKGHKYLNNHVNVKKKYTYRTFLTIPFPVAENGVKIFLLLLRDGKETWRVQRKGREGEDAKKANGRGRKWIEGTGGERRGMEQRGETV